MKKCEKLVLVLCFLFSSNLWAQDSLSQEIRPILRKNVIRLDLIMIAAAGYDRLLWQSGKHKIGVSALFSSRKAEYTGNTPALSYSHRLYYFTAGGYYLYGKRNHHLELNLQYSLGSGVLLEGEWISGETLPWGDYRVYSGYSTHYHVRKEGTLINDPDIQRLITEKKEFTVDNRAYKLYRTHSAAFRVGYRYQRTNGGFFLRVGVSLVNMVWYSDDAPMRLTLLGTTRNTSDNIPLPYLGLGWSF